jgi:glucose-6-phosphate 1-dehydrogenase
MFATVADGLAKAGCVAGARVVLEKPFGRDLPSAVELNRTLHQYFDEDVIFRIDHYMGKEPVQNIVYFRLANPVVKSVWNNQHIAQVQITMAEDFGIGTRGRLYEELGAIRDVVQNHMLQVICCLATEVPDGRGHHHLRDARQRLLASVRSLTPADVVRGQYRGYRQEPSVAADSQVETFAAIRFHIDNARWQGVPFCVRVGKCLPVRVVEVRVIFRCLTDPVLDDAAPPPADYYRFQFSPNMVLALGTNVKKAGESIRGEHIDLIAVHQTPDEMQPYERLLGDAIHGDPELFIRADAVEQCWRIVDPVLGGAAPLHFYEPGTWGPAEADKLLSQQDCWHAPIMAANPG